MIGDALAMAAWGYFFDHGLLLDPRPMFEAFSDSTLAAIMRTYPARAAGYQLAQAEAWQVVRIGVAYVTIQHRLDVEFKTVPVSLDARSLSRQELVASCAGWGRR